MTDIVSIIDRIISLGQEIYARIEANKEALDSIKQLEKILGQLKNVFANIINSNFDKSHIVSIKDTLERTQSVYAKCAKDLGVNEDQSGKNYKKVKQIFRISKSPNILADIQRTMNEVKYHVEFTKDSLSIIQRSQVSQMPTTSTSVTTTTTTTTSTSILGSELKEIFAAPFNELLTRFKNECKELQEKLDRCTISIEPYFFEGFGSDNPEAISFWKDRFRSEELNISSIAPYEASYSY